MEQLKARLMLTSTRKNAREPHDVLSLVTGPLEGYLLRYQPRRPKQKRRRGREQPIGPFESMVPYTITLIGKVRAGFDVRALYAAFTPTSDVWRPGEISVVVSPDGRMKLPDREETTAVRYLPNHTSVGMWLRAEGQHVLLRISAFKFEVLGCKADADIDEVWEHLSSHVNGLGVDVRLDEAAQLDFYRRRGYMRNYSVYLGYQLDLRRLASAMRELEGATLFRGCSNLSLQTNLRLSHPFLGVEEEDGSDEEEVALKSTTRTRRPRRGLGKWKDHVFTVFHTGKCLYSGKGGLVECACVFESFRTLMARLRSVVEVCGSREP